MESAVSRHRCAVAILLITLLRAVAQEHDASGDGGGGDAAPTGTSARGGGVGCGSGEHLTCVRLAQPMLSDAALVFPDNMADVGALCMRWREFVRCVKEFTARCFSPAQQEAFVRAVQAPVGQAHRLCSDPRYQAEYLQNAFCIHATITENGRCARSYKAFLEDALGEASGDFLCCSHRRFRDCVLTEAGPCGSGGGSGSGRRFAEDLLDKAFSYIQAKCVQVDSSDCGQERSISSATASEGTFPASMPATGTASNGARTINSSQPAQPRSNQLPLTPQSPDEEGRPWQPGKGIQQPSQSPIAQPQPPARPSSHGRGLGWTPSGDSSGGEDGGLTSGGNPDRDTYRVTNTQGADSPASTRAWYPWAKRGDAADEPNQQGLSGRQSTSSARTTRAGMASVLLAAALMIVNAR